MARPGITYLSMMSAACVNQVHELCQDASCEDWCHDTDDLEPREPRCGHAWDSHSSHGCEVRGCACEVECR